MKCPQCGFKNRHSAKYCAKCGMTLKKQNNKQLIGLAIVLVSVCIVISTIFIFSHFSTKQYENIKKEADTYLKKKDYKQAEDNYLKSLDVDPKQVDTYKQLSKLYIQQGRYQEAKQILEKAKDNVKDKELDNQYTLATSLQDHLSKDDARVKEGTYTTGYIKYDTDWLRPDTVHEVKGILASRLIDFDKDGQEELLIIKLDNSVLYNESQCNRVNIEMYELENGKTILSDSFAVENNVLGGCDEEFDEVFIKEYRDDIFICGGFKQSEFINADGISYSTFILNYNGKFQKIYDDSGAGSSCEESDESFKNALKTAGFINELRSYDDDFPLFTYIDDVDDIVFQIEGKRLEKNVYYENKTIENLGKVQFEIRLTNKKPDKRGIDLYKDILQNYYDFQFTGLDSNEWDYRYEGNSDGLSLIKPDYIYYCLEDIDGDGVEELFVGGEKDGKKAIYDIWAYDGMSTKQPLNCYGFGIEEKTDFEWNGDRKIVELCENNIIKISNYTNHEIIFYSMKNSKLTLKENYIKKDSDYIINGKRVSKNEFNERIDFYKTISTDKIQWADINGNIFPKISINKKGIEEELDHLNTILEESYYYSQDTPSKIWRSKNAVSEWNNKMYKMISLLKTQLTKEDQNQLIDEQKQFLKDTETKASEAVSDLEDEDSKKLTKTQFIWNKYQERTYEMLKRL